MNCNPILYPIRKDEEENNTDELIGLWGKLDFRGLPIIINTWLMHFTLEILKINMYFITKNSGNKPRPDILRNYYEDNE